MKLSQLMFATVFAIGMSNAFAREFNHAGIQINLPDSFTERKIAHRLPEGHENYVFTKQYGTGSPQEAIGVSLYIRDISAESTTQQRLKTKGAAHESELSLAVAARNVFTFPEFRLLKDIRHLDISGNKAATATVSYSASYADPVWTTGVVNVAIYCITESTREIQFQVFALSDAPKDLVSSTIEAVENVKIEAP